MKLRLTLLSLLAFAALVGVSIWASAQLPIMAAIADLAARPADGQNPWLVATLFDAYFGFLWFWAWIAYKETGALPRVAWLVLILLLGNLAMAAYMLLQLRRLQAGATPADLLLRRARP